ncbi:MAG: hypothetical protein HQL46_13240 [Gammaproteobacteria bacterium]|nr:hypothetical protein [Gammaproteobacteria bacterium]
MSNTSLFPPTILRANQRFSLFGNQVNCWNVGVAKDTKSLCYMKVEYVMEKLTIPVDNDPLRMENDLFHQF